MEPHPLAGQEVTYRNGTPIISAHGPGTDVILAPLGSATGRHELASRVYFLVAVRNRSPRPIEVSEASFRATGNGGPAPVVPAIQIEDEIRHNAAFAQSVNALAGVFSSIAASSAGTTRFTATSSTGGTVSGTAYNPGAAAEAQRQAASDTAARSAAIAANEKAQLSSLSSLLQRNTVEPGEWVSGTVVIEPPRMTACGVDSTLSTPSGPVVQQRRPGPCDILFVATPLDTDAYSFSFKEVVDSPQGN